MQKVKKSHGLSIEKIIGKVFLQIQKICKTCQIRQHLYSFGERAQPQKAARQNENSSIKTFYLSGGGLGKHSKQYGKCTERLYKCVCAGISQPL